MSFPSSFIGGHITRQAHNVTTSVDHPKLLRCPFPERQYTRSNPKVIPVSYTHLDVYKRQGRFIIIQTFFGYIIK